MREQQPPPRPISAYTLSAQECLEVLGGADLYTLRALAASAMLLKQMAQGHMNGQLRTDVSRGVPRETYIAGERVKTA